MQKKTGRNRRVALALIVILLVGVALVYRRVSREVNLVGMLAAGSQTSVSVPRGFSVNVFAQDLDGPRFMQFGPDGRLYVAERGANRILLLDDRDGDGTADTRLPFAVDINQPHSVAYYQQAWYVGVPSGVIKLEDRNADGLADERTTLIDDYPSSHHSTRTVAFLPDGRMVVSIGSSCNVCEEADPRRAAILIYDGPSAEGERVLASGIRNAVGLTVQPETGELWATNNGRDRMGDDLPPDTILKIEDGADYGWPRCHSASIVDPDFGFDGACEGVETPVLDLQAHSAPLGLVFYDGQSFPTEYRGDLFVAFHGSWNRSVPTGYKVVRISFDGDGSASPALDFATGWLTLDEGEVSGRPVGLAVGPDGALYVSDDTGGFIYRIQYEGG